MVKKLLSMYEVEVIKIDVSLKLVLNLNIYTSLKLFYGKKIQQYLLKKLVFLLVFKLQPSTMIITELLILSILPLIEKRNF